MGTHFGNGFKLFQFILRKDQNAPTVALQWVLGTRTLRANARAVDQPTIARAGFQERRSVAALVSFLFVASFLFLFYCFLVKGGDCDPLTGSWWSPCSYLVAVAVVVRLVEHYCDNTATVGVVLESRGLNLVNKSKLKKASLNIEVICFFHLLFSDLLFWRRARQICFFRCRLNHALFYLLREPVLYKFKSQRQVSKCIQAVGRSKLRLIGSAGA